MTNPTRIGDAVQDVLRLARARVGMTREQRLRLSAAALLAHLTHCHDENDITSVLKLALQLNGDHAHDAADTALQALADISAALDADCDATGVALYNPRTTVLAIRGILNNADAATRPTLPPFEERHASACRSRAGTLQSGTLYCQEPLGHEGLHQSGDYSWDGT